MKNFLLTLTAVLIVGTSLQASNIEDELLSLINNEILVLSLEDKNQKELLVSTKYCPIDHCICIEFKSELVMIQLYNSKGEIELMFPVSSKKVKLGLSLFESDSYKMAFTIDGQSEVQFANINIK